jgi:alkyl sulfatase BDS1-like metallo-beta-lactamase superfamily hydrolase
MVRYMGGAEEMLRKAADDHAAGDYRWVAQVCNWVVFADPTNTAARELGADALEQMGYQSESAVWRGFYLMGAQELRQGTPQMKGIRPTGTADTLRAMTPQMVLNLCGMKLHGPRARDERLQLAFSFTDGWTTHLTVAHGVVHYSDRRTGDPDATITTSALGLALVANDLSTIDEQVAAGEMSVHGDRSAFERFIGLLDQFELFFPIIEP